MYLSGLPEFFFPKTSFFLSVLTLVKKRMCMSGFPSVISIWNGRRERYACKETQGVLAGSDSSEQWGKTQHQLLAPGHTHTNTHRKERPEDEHFLHISLKGHVRTACSSLPPGSPLTTFLLHPSSCAILRGKEGLLVSTTITDVFLAPYAVILMYFAWLTFNPW